MQSRPIRLSELRIGAIINTSSGGCDFKSEAEMIDLLQHAGLMNCKTWCGEANDIGRSFAEAATHQLELLIVLGGDGTIRTAAQACSRAGSYLIPLPGGTMNMLPRALYGDVSWQDALGKTLADPVTKVLSGGRVADNLFFVAAVIGAPALWVETRESLREGDVRGAVQKGVVALQTMFETKIQYSISPEINGEAEVVAVICPLISEEMSESEQALEAAAIDVENASELIGLATVAAFGKWRDDQRVTLSKSQRVTVQSSKQIPLFLDGERVSVGNKAEICFVARTVNVLVPGLSVNKSKL
ncbi:MAG TPA: diacylglycerol kinase family protein [Candidatus Udaeobacter sp.]|nr:diacylglycerol kinase family protein [Candidatus Udaeobacter sp.]